MIHPIADLKAWFALKRSATQIKEAYMQSGHSWFSTRFWLTAVSTTSTLWAAIHGFIPQPWGTIIPMVGVGIYTVVETIRKVVIDVQAAKAGQAPAVTPPTA